MNSKKRHAYCILKESFQTQRTQNCKDIHLIELHPLPSLSFQVYLGSHASFGEDGQEIVAQVAIGREDYGKAQCSFKKRSNAPSSGCINENTRQPRMVAPFSLFEAIFGRFRRKRRGYPISKRQGLLEKAISVGKDITFTNDIALVKLSHKVNFSDKIQPVRLPKNTFNYQGYQCYVTGWGIQGPFEGPSASLKGAELVVSLAFFLLLYITCQVQIQFSKGFCLGIVLQ